MSSAVSHWNLKTFIPIKSQINIKQLTKISFHLFCLCAVSLIPFLRTHISCLVGWWWILTPALHMNVITPSPSRCFHWRSGPTKISCQSQAKPKLLLRILLRKLMLSSVFWMIPSILSKENISRGGNHYLRK